MKDRKYLLMPFGVIAMLMALAATASACTRFVGQLDVTGSAPTSGTARSTGTDAPNHASSTSGDGANGSQILSSGGGAGNYIARVCGGLSTACVAPGTITISTGTSGAIPAITAASCVGIPPVLHTGTFCGEKHSGFAAGTYLPDGDYDVRFTSLPTYKTHNLSVGGQGRSCDLENTSGYCGTAAAADDYQWGDIGGTQGTGQPNCFQGVLLSPPPAVDLGVVTISGGAGAITNVIASTDPTAIGTATARFTIPPSTPTAAAALATGTVAEGAVCIQTTAADVNAVLNGAQYANMAPVTIL